MTIPPLVYGTLDPIPLHPPGNIANRHRIDCAARATLGSPLN